MTIQGLVALMAIAFMSCANAVELPLQGRDYYALQIASGRNLADLKAVYQRHVELPFVRIEKRGALYVLRAGFWADEATAQRAVGRTRTGESFLRIAAFRPEAIVKKNWQDADMAGAPMILTAPKSVPIETPPPEVKGAEDAVLVPFNQEDFLLAYDVFVGSGDLEQAYRVAEKAAAQAPQDAAWQKRLATVAAWTQRHDVAAQYYFLSRQQASDRDEARRLFQAGMDALMAGSRFKQAMEAADKYMGDLANDRATLRYMARAALAAGDQARAAAYIDKLVFRPKGVQAKP